MNYIGLIIATVTFIIIGIFHPIVIKTEYHVGVKVWWIYLLLGIAFVGASLFISNPMFSTIVGVIGCGWLWGIRELFEQRKRVQRGWFPKKDKKDSEIPPVPSQDKHNK